MSDIAIRVNNLSKRYRIGLKDEMHDTLGGTIADFVTRPIRNFRRLHRLSRFSENGHDPEDIIWALRDISFEVKQGEVIGIIGRNGAGKSTLLKILSRITEPTEGSATINGRIGSLLEVGTGFHQELTGRENIYLNGAVLGMTQKEIDRKFDEIVDFSGVERFIDTPVKRYSSGMKVRLAFAVAAHLEPEILLVDEVLAVGDAEFQKKCLGKMGDVTKEGRTIIFVSHNMQAVSTLTRRSVVLSNGYHVYDGPTSSAISKYLSEGSDRNLVYSDEPSDSEPKITRVELRTSEPNNTQLNGQPMEVHLEITTPVPISGASLSFQAYDSLQQPVLHLWTFDSERPMCREAGIFQLVCEIPKVRLYIGRYNLTIHFSERTGGTKFQTIDGICPFEVVMHGRHREFKWEPGTCVYLEECNWQIEKMGSI